MKKVFYILFRYVYILMIIVSIILPFFTTEGYSIFKNTLSELGAQNTSYNWVINIVFIALSCITIIVGITHLKGYYISLILLFLFIISFFMTAIFLHAPIDTSLDFNHFEDELHSVFSTATGIFFCIYSLSVSFITKKFDHKILSILVSLVALILSYSMFVHSDFRGIYQRGIFIMAFGWLLYAFKNYTYLDPKNRILKLKK
ncbi:DUF998 domain-containing protein [Aquimarina algicola]|uniref:DUF998 domain-containing protein n=1 Tax=Aquimarina algicola TaxID=2589995 RepID=A0A504JA24_9FLAO|nr:DUF998 domain-containing protein [Aquimarina algicola]TPN87494.1 DUF998 domain-containing protein [Aquimarina algicola]